MKPKLAAVAKGPKAVKGWPFVAETLSTLEKKHGLPSTGEYLDRAKVLVRKLREKNDVLGARKFKLAARAAVAELRRGQVAGDDDKQPTLAEEIAAWVKLASAASGIFGGVMSLVILYGIYKFFFSGR